MKAKTIWVIVGVIFALGAFIRGLEAIGLVELEPVNPRVTTKSAPAEPDPPPEPELPALASADDRIDEAVALCEALAKTDCLKEHTHSTFMGSKYWEFTLVTRSVTKRGVTQLFRFDVFPKRSDVQDGLNKFRDSKDMDVLGFDGTLLRYSSSGGKYTKSQQKIIDELKARQ